MTMTEGYKAYSRASQLDWLKPGHMEFLFLDTSSARILSRGAKPIYKSLPNVHFGSLADICSAKGHVRFAPNSDRDSGFPQTVMSALPPKADMCGAVAHVCFGPIADIRRHREQSV